MKSILTIKSQPSIKEWVAIKIQNNPKYFGGDNGTINITRVYLDEVLGIQLSDDDIRAIHTVARAKNRFISNNKIFDYRTKER